MHAELESEKENYENARSAVEQAELARERKKRHLRDGHDLYESRLALKIQTSKKDGGLFFTHASMHTVRMQSYTPVVAFMLPALTSCPSVILGYRISEISQHTRNMLCYMCDNALLCYSCAHVLLHLCLR